MKVLSVVGFRNVCENIAPVVYCFSTPNQKSDKTYDLKIKCTYQKMLSTTNPNRICLVNGYKDNKYNGHLCFENVNHINYYDENSKDEHVFEIVCDSLIADGKAESYFLVAEKS